MAPEISARAAEDSGDLIHRLRDVIRAVKRDANGHWPALAEITEEGLKGDHHLQVLALAEAGQGRPGQHVVLRWLRQPGQHYRDRVRLSELGVGRHCRRLDGVARVAGLEQPFQRLGDRIKVTQTVRVGSRKWTAETAGAYRGVNYLATGVTTERIPEDDVVVATFTQGGPAVTLSGAASASDPDNLTLVAATVAITSGSFVGDGDVLATNVAGTSITASYNAVTETLTLTGSDTLSHYNQVLDSVTFNSTSSNPDGFGLFPTRTVTWVLNDGSASFNLSTAQTETINIIAVNSPPTLTGVAASASYTEEGAATTLSGSSRKISSSDETSTPMKSSALRASARRSSSTPMRRSASRRTTSTSSCSLVPK